MSNEVKITNDQFLKELIERGEKTDDGYFQYAHIIACLLDKRLHEQLEQLVNGPIWDGDVICKCYRNGLIELGLAIRVCCKGEQGYTGATYFADTILKAIKEIKTGKRGK